MKTYVVEDNPTIRENLISTLEELAPVEAVGTSDSEEQGAEWLTRNDAQWDLAIVDLFLKKGSGLGVLQACRARRPLQKIVVFSNYATPEMRRRCAELGVDAVFDKSTEIDCLLAYCVTQSQKLDQVANDESALQRA
ncbi:response regulator transcription factor [Polaromonas sp. P5_D5]